jgi:lipid-A-disaccharide synthase
MPVFGDAVRRLTAERPDLRVALAVADGMAERVKARLAAWRDTPFLVQGEASRLSAMRAASVALACSGTVTTELALAGCPMVVAYRLGPLTHLVAKALIRTRYITLFNVAAQAFVAPERVQAACRGDVLAADLARLLDDAPAREAQVAAQTAALELMRAGIADPIAAAADAVTAVILNRENR